MAPGFYKLVLNQYQGYIFLYHTKYIFIKIWVEEKYFGPCEEQAPGL